MHAIANNERGHAIEEEWGGVYERAGRKEEKGETLYLNYKLKNKQKRQIIIILRVSKEVMVQPNVHLAEFKLIVKKSSFKSHSQSSQKL